MPAPNSILIRSKEYVPFAPVDKAGELYREVLAVSVKMPKRYTWYLSRDMSEHAAKVMALTKKANAVYVVTERDKARRLNRWKKAGEELAALDSFMDRCMEIQDRLTYKNEETGRCEGVSISELLHIQDLINEEKKLIASARENEKKRYSKVTG